ncbi:hypothetical protein HBH56_023490 [Parastagonospora nodorum]|nr:hypothetical protein HBH56_023490 [Parastagonospora nodorum]KAH3934286.1 hypothetical protein HBH54_058550 [Parastagonospora nodorum]KAH4141681.1 hypothetical protein HBH45_058230 [Parastagonospora nodorum]KAH4161438.1 hypothetical protein HBH44_091820 [Parastagonospora nodorum]KAH4580623.1 hypothetical protein HBH84_052250 [Parastagonospora nodorum]
MDLNFVPSVAFISDVYIADSLRARILINLSAVLLRVRTLINLSAVLYEQVSIIDLNFVPSVAFNAIGNVELIGNLLGDADRVNNNNNNLVGDNMEELICVGKVKHTYQGLIPRELGSIYVLRSVDEIWADVANVFDIVVSKLDEVPTRELLRDNSCKFYRLVITGEDTHCKQIIKKAYIMLLERASLILFMI